ncbi:hypothetical protein AGMMS4952_18180 [Spirochaetia bacterium]|nr:hypothetical protein AGMMS4952_18180 [Spirochaetia bacterium]
MENLSPQTIILLCVFVLFCLIFLLIGRRMGFNQGRRQERADWEGHKLEDIVKSRLRACLISLQVPYQPL